MGDISQTYFTRFRYRVVGLLGDKVIADPIGFDEDRKIFKRSSDTHGVFTNLSSDLEFYKGDKDNDGGYDYLKETYDIYGINADVILIKEEDISGSWIERYRGNFDFSTYSRTIHKIQIKFNESGVYELIKARQTEDLELDRLTTMDGEVLEELSVEEVNIPGRDILIIDELIRTVGQDGSDYIGKVISSGGDINYFVGAETLLYTWQDSAIINYNISNRMQFGGIGGGCMTLPFTAVAEQSGNVQTIYGYDLNCNAISSIYQQGTTAPMMYRDSDNAKVLKINFDLNFEFLGRIDVGETGITNPFAVYLEMAIFGDGTLYNYKRTELLYSIAAPAGAFSYNEAEKLIPLNTGESAALIMRVSDVQSNKPFSAIEFQSWTYQFAMWNSTVYINDETYFDPTSAKFILPFEALNRIIAVITNKQDILKSKALGRTDLGYEEDGQASLTGLTNGFWVRRFNTEKITTSFKNFTESFQAVWQLGYGIERIGFKEFIRVEHISHFYQNVVTIKVQVKPTNILRTVNKDYFYSSLSIGYSKPSGATLYTEALGLDEYNIRNTFTTAITKLKNVFQNISIYRADSYGTEFARRKPKAKFPEEDTRYDLDVMILDLKRGFGSVFEQRKWEDDFIVPEPFDKPTTGIYSPWTATNLRFSPINVLLRWGFWLKGGLLKNLEEYIRYSSSNGNSALKMQSNIPGSKEYTENGNILNSDLDNNLFEPETIEFESPVSYELMQQVQGSIEVGGEKIMNYYGLVEFENEYNELEYGYLLTLEPNGNGKWSLLKANSRTNKVLAIQKGKTRRVGPKNLVIKQVKDTQIVTLSWLAAESDSGISHYRIYINDVLSANTKGATTNFRFDDAELDKQLCYYVVAITNDNECTEASNTECFTVKNPPLPGDTISNDLDFNLNNSL